MDTIEFRGMDSPIETVSTATASPVASVENHGGGSSYQGHSCPENPENGHVYYSRCEDAKTHSMPDMYLTNTGRVLDVTMTLKRICPCRRVAVGLLVSEVDQAGNEYSRGFKAITVPAHYNSGCCDIEMPRTRFILPEDLRVDGGTSMCDGSRHFIVRTEAHYVDSSVTMP
ncbi:MAG: hypothetical protein Q4F18_07970 [Clostridia bacterium]|nr:hypothetical protein [Clostridia bacterium]